jgi:excisionase family DNA binding protein
MGTMLFVGEVAAMLRLTPDTVRELVAEGRLPAVRLRNKGRLMFRLEDVQGALRQAGPANASALTAVPSRALET